VWHSRPRCENLTTETRRKTKIFTADLRRGTLIKALATNFANEHESKSKN
jgi:hypothetical protein